MLKNLVYFHLSNSELELSCVYLGSHRSLFPSVLETESANDKRRQPAVTVSHSNLLPW